MSRDLVRACAIGRAATLRRGPGPAGVRADGLFSPAGWDTPTWAQATCGGRVPTCRANACGGRPAATSVSRPASAHGLRKSGQGSSVVRGCSLVSARMLRVCAHRVPTGPSWRGSRRDELVGTVNVHTTGAWSVRLRSTTGFTAFTAVDVVSSGGGFSTSRRSRRGEIARQANTPRAWQSPSRAGISTAAWASGQRPGSGPLPGRWALSGCLGAGRVPRQEEKRNLTLPLPGRALGVRPGGPVTPEVATRQPRTLVLADGRGASGKKNQPVRRAFIRMAVGTAVILVAIVLGGYFASVRRAEREVLANVPTGNEAVARTLIAPTGDRLRDGDAAALA